MYTRLASSVARTSHISRRAATGEPRERKRGAPPRPAARPRARTRSRTRAPAGRPPDLFSDGGRRSRSGQIHTDI